MKVGFYIPRLNYLKLFGPVIEYFLSQGNQVTLFCDSIESPSGNKAYLYPALDEIPSFRGKVEKIAFHSVSEFASMVQERGVQAIFFCNFNPIGAILRKELDLLSHRLIIAQLQYAIEFMYLGRDLNFSDVVYTLSESWTDWWKAFVQHHRLVPRAFLDDFFKDIDKKAVPVGSPEAEQLKLITAKTVHENYHIPSNKKILLYLPFCWTRKFSLCSHISNRLPDQTLKPMRSICCEASRFLPNAWCGMLDRDIVDAVRKFCDLNDALFIVKSREKTIIPLYLETIADRIIFDKTYYPFTTVELLSIADLCIHFYSSTVMEAVYTKTPSICISPNSEHFNSLYNDRFFIPDFTANDGNFYNFKGVNYHIEHDKFVDSFPSQGFSDYLFDNKMADIFMRRFMGPSDLKSCARIHEDLSKRINL